MRSAEVAGSPLSTDGLSLRPCVPASLSHAFSLLEVMIAIVILGLGLIMVGTMFPVAWDRARTLTEATTQQTITKNAHAIIQNLTRVSGQPSENPLTSATSFEGDLQVYPPDSVTAPPVTACGAYGPPYGSLVTDTRVHALNLQNVLVAPGSGTKDFLVNEKPWALADPERLLDQLNQEVEDATPGTREKQFFEATFFTPRVTVGERVFPSVGPPPIGAAATPEALARWTERLADSRFVWAVFHRLESLACFDVSNPDFGATRSLEMFYVTLRRPQPTLRYARQDPRSAPDPCELTRDAVAPKAMDAKEDVLFPVAWRVQVQFPGEPTIVRRWTDATRTVLTGFDTGIPTEIEVPARGLSGDVKVGMMLVQMFQPGTRFIDEITGQMYRVAKRRIIGDEGEKAVLTLDREVVFEDLNLAPIQLCGQSLPDPVCDCQPDRLVGEELLRTVWVFPPPVEPGHGAGAVTFSGNPPVVDISVRTLTIAPTQ